MAPPTDALESAFDWRPDRRLFAVRGLALCCWLGVGLFVTTSLGPVLGDPLVTALYEVVPREGGVWGASTRATSLWSTQETWGSPWSR